jgi:hypothetical protein
LAIVQTNPERPNEKVVIRQDNPAVIRVLQHQLPNGAMVQTQEFDLTEFQGKPWRLYVEEDGALSVALDGVHYWLLAEAVLPERRVETQEIGDGDNGEPTIEHVELPLDLQEVDVLVYPWPNDEEVA